MPAGLQVFNDGGVVQIDGDYVNMSFVTKGTEQSARTGYGGARISSATFTCPTFPVVFFHSPTGFHHYKTISNGGNSYTIEWTGTATYYVFSPVMTSPGGFGLEVFNPAGTRVFSSVDKAMKVVACVTADSYGGLPGGSTYAVACAGTPRGFMSLNHGGTFLIHPIIGITKVTATGYITEGKTQDVLEGSPSSPVPGGTYYPPANTFTHTVIDVTGF